MPNSLIEWPKPEGKFTDTGEGRLHALALFRGRDEEKEFSTGSAAYTTKPSVITSIADGEIEQADIFPSYKLVNADPKLDNLISAPFRAVVMLGSTEHSLWDNSAGEYYGITSGSLTEKGEMLLRILEEVYGAPAIFITGLVS